MVTVLLPARVVLIAGPPCSGKTRLAEELASPGDVVLDFDTLARGLGSPARWVHEEPYRTRAEMRMRDLMALLPGSAPGTAYLIRSVPDPRHRATTARKLRAHTTHLLNPGLEECVRRAEADGRPAGTVESITLWYQRYRPWSGDKQTERSITQSHSGKEVNGDFVEL